MSSSCSDHPVPSRNLQLTLGDMALLLVGLACGCWSIRVSGILRQGSLPAFTYSLLFLDYFVWGLSFVGPVVVVLHRLAVPRARNSAGEACLFWLGAVNLGVIAAGRVAGSPGLAVLTSFLFFRYHFGWLILVILSLYVVAASVRSNARSWPHVFGLLVFIGQSIGAIGFRLAPIDLVIHI